MCRSGDADFATRAAAAQEAAEDPGDVLRSIGTNITAQLVEPGFRGCAFINAASEFEDPQGPIMRAVLAHRAWFHALVRDAFASAGHAQPDLAASHYVMLRDGATTAGHLGDPSQARDTFQRGLAGLLHFTDNPPRPTTPQPIPRRPTPPRGRAQPRPSRDRRTTTGAPASRPNNRSA